MVKCSRFCLRISLRMVNVCINVTTVVMIVYSLWALKEWRAKEVTASDGSLPKPWFIFVFLGISIAVCLSTIFGHAVVSNIYILILTAYIVFLCFLLLMQIGVIIVIFFQKDWASEIHEEYVGQYSEFRKFLIFHLNLCRYFVLIILLAQVLTGVLAVLLCVLRPKSGSHGDNSCEASSTRSELKQSFLVCCDSPEPLLPTLSSSSDSIDEKNLIEELD